MNKAAVKKTRILRGYDYYLRISGSTDTCVVVE